MGLRLINPSQFYGPSIMPEVSGYKGAILLCLHGPFPVLYGPISILDGWKEPSMDQYQSRGKLLAKKQYVHHKKCWEFS